MFFRFVLILSAILLFCMGLLMIFNTTSAEVLDLALERSTHQALFKQLGYGLIGFCFAYGVKKAGYERFLALSPLLMLIFCFCLLLVFIPGIGKEVNGSKRWIGLGPFSFQPSEFIKLVVPAYMIYYLSKLDPETLSFKGFLQLGGLLSIPILLILVEPNNGTAAVVALLVATLCFLTRIPLRFWCTPLLVLALIGAFSAYHLPYVSKRIEVYLHPELDLLGKGHQPYQAKIAAGSGGLFGRGPSNSLQKLSYLPEAQNDYIAAIYAEEFGFLGISLLLLLYMSFCYAGFRIAMRSSNPQALYLAAILSFLVGFQAFMNLGVVSGLLPSTGLNLPFFSQGGTSLIANMIAVALLLDIGMNHNEKTT